jgi:site-specific DNA recombinase
MPEPRRAAIYCRISDDRNKDELGVTRQEQVCRRLARARGWQVVEPPFVDDDKSAFSGKHRDAYERMCEAIKAGEVDAIVTWAPARLTRHPRELEDLIDLLEAHRIEVATHIAGDYDLSTSSGRLTARVVGSVARHESEEKSERVKLKMSEIAKAGKFHGGGYRRYGFEIDGVTVRPEEAEVIRTMARRVAEGCGLRRLQAELAADGINSATGKTWNFSVIRRVLTNPRIAGLSHYRGEVVGEAEWPAIVDRRTFDEVRAILGDPRRKQARPVQSLLGGLLFSPSGTKLTADISASRRADGTGRAVYRGKGISIDADKTEEFVIDYVFKKTDKAILAPPKKAASVPSEVARLERELAELADDRGKGLISRAEWLAAREPLQARLEAARRQVPPVRTPAGVTAVLGRAGALRQQWPAMTADQRRRALAAVLEKVEISPARTNGPRRFDASRIKPFPRY